jgi:hypothetical protein
MKRRTRTPVAEGGTMGEKLPNILPKVATPCCVLAISRNLIVDFLKLFVHKHQLQEN